MFTKRSSLSPGRLRGSKAHRISRRVLVAERLEERSLLSVTPLADGLTAAPYLAADAVGGTQFVEQIAGVGADAKIYTIAGTGQAGYSGDRGPATKAKLNQPMGVAVDGKGNVYIADSWNDVVREVYKNGEIRTIRGHGAIRGFPTGLAVDRAGTTLFIAEQQNEVIHKIDLHTGAMTRYAGTGIGSGYDDDGHPATQTQLTLPTSLALDKNGDLYVTEGGSISPHNSVRKIDHVTHLVSTVVGGVIGLNDIGSVAVDDNLNVFFNSDNKIYEADARGTNQNIRLLGDAGGQFGNSVQGIAVTPSGDTVYVSVDHQIKAIQGGTFTTVAGNGTRGFSGDGGPPLAAEFNYPNDIALDSAGNVYIADSHNNRIRATREPPKPVINVGFTWRMADRTVADAHGRIAEHNSHDYVDASSFRVTIDGSGSRIDRAVPSRYTLVVRDQGGNAYATSPVKGKPGVFTASLPQGSFTVVLTAFRGQDSGSATQTITVRDILVVAIGDSTSSGEGNPEVARKGKVAAQWMRNLDGDKERNRQDVISHRSSFAAPAQMALDLERRDPHTSVTFVFVSASGATIDEGGLGPYAGIDNAPGYDKNKPMPSQMDQVDQITQGRTIDVMTVAFGGNDIGFSRIITTLLLADYTNTFTQVQTPLLSAIRTGTEDDWKAVGSIVSSWKLGWAKPESSPIAGLYGLVTEYSRLSQRITALHPNNVFMTGYPDLTTQLVGKSVVVSERILTDIRTSWPRLKISRTELQWLLDNVYPALTSMLRAQANKYGWTFVDTFNAFRGHGYGADRAHRWIVTATESAAQQGPDDHSKTKGTLHPNRQGHRQEANLLDTVVIPAVFGTTTSASWQLGAVEVSQFVTDGASLQLPASFAVAASPAQTLAVNAPLRSLTSSGVTFVDRSPAAASGPEDQPSGDRGAAAIPLLETAPQATAKTLLAARKPRGRAASDLFDAALAGIELTRSQADEFFSCV